MDNFTETEPFETNDLYLSPEKFRFLRTQKEPSFNVVKSDVFSLGLVLLEAGLLHKIQDIYGDSRCKEILDGKL